MPFLEVCLQEMNRERDWRVKCMFAFHSTGTTADSIYLWACTILDKILHTQQHIVCYHSSIKIIEKEIFIFKWKYYQNGMVNMKINKIKRICNESEIVKFEKKSLKMFIIAIRIYCDICISLQNIIKSEEKSRKNINRNKNREHASSCSWME